MDEHHLLHSRFLIGIGHIFVWALGVVPIILALLGIDVFSMYASFVAILIGWYVRRHGTRIRSLETQPYSKWL